MILSDRDIHRAKILGDITIDPFDPESLGPNSYDLRLGRTLLVYSGVEDNPDRPLDPRDQSSLMTRPLLIPDSGLVLRPQRLYLAHTQEIAGSTKYVPMIEGRSSVARLGLFIHVTAGFGDIGFVNQWTLEMVPVLPIRVYVGMRICQIFFHTPETAPVKDYRGKYALAASDQPVASKIYNDREFMTGVQDG